MKLEDKLVQLRKEKGLSQMYVADEMGVSRQAISRWEVGAAMPSTENLRKLAELYGVSADALLNESVNLAAVQRGCRTAEDVWPPVENVSAGILRSFAAKPIIYVSIAVIFSLLIFYIGYIIGRADKAQMQDDPIPLSELDTMDFDFSDAEKSTLGWDDFVEGGE